MRFTPRVAIIRAAFAICIPPIAPIPHRSREPAAALGESHRTRELGRAPEHADHNDEAAEMKVIDAKLAEPSAAKRIDRRQEPLRPPSKSHS